MIWIYTSSYSCRRAGLLSIHCIAGYWWNNFWRRMKAFHHHLLTHLTWLSYHQGSLCAMRILNASIVRSVPECRALCRWIMHGWAVSNLCDRQKYFRLGQKIFWDKKIFGWVSAPGCVTGVAAPVAGGWMESCVNLGSNQITGSPGWRGPGVRTTATHISSPCPWELFLYSLGSRRSRKQRQNDTKYSNVSLAAMAGLEQSDPM